MPPSLPASQRRWRFPLVGRLVESTADTHDDRIARSERWLASRRTAIP
jgi:hypothetical protein